MDEYFDEDEPTPHWPEKLESIRKFVVTVLWFAVISVSILLVLRYLPDPGHNPKPPSSSISIHREPSKKYLDESVIRSLSKAREKSIAQAQSELDLWVESLMVKVDEDFLKWYFGYWTQQKLAASGLFHASMNLVYSKHPKAEEKMIQAIEGEFRKRVMPSALAQMEIERILRRAIEVYLLTLRNELDVSARNFNISQADWERYLDDISVTVSQVDAGRHVPLTMKALLGYGGSRLLAKHAGSMAGRFGAATEGLFIRRGATNAAIRISGNTLGKVAGRFSGPLVMAVILAWDVYDYRRTEIENRPILRNAIEKYLGLVRDSILYDPSTGLESILMGIERNVVGSLEVRE